MFGVGQVDGSNPGVRSAPGYALPRSLSYGDVRPLLNATGYHILSVHVIQSPGVLD